MDTVLCCPQFEPALWESKTFVWSEKKFIKDRAFSFLYMPLNFGTVMTRTHELVRASGATIPEYLCLSDHSSKWKIEVFLAVDKEIPGAENVTLSGRYFNKVYEGPYRDTGKWCKEFESYTREQGMKIRKWFMWYTTCPKCARKYGKNYSVIIARMD